MFDSVLCVEQTSFPCLFAADVSFPPRVSLPCPFPAMQPRWQRVFFPRMYVGDLFFSWSCVRSSFLNTTHVLKPETRCVQQAAYAQVPRCTASPFPTRMHCCVCTHTGPDTKSHRVLKNLRRVYFVPLTRGLQGETKVAALLLG